MDNSRNWWKEAVVYQIYVRSFKDSNGDGIGDLRGILEKLDYLKHLGVDVLWLTPVYQSPNCDNGYDISDYRSIMKEFGTMEDFDLLLEESHKRGIKIIMDLVVNHTSDEHEWFVKSRSPEPNPYWDYYFWRDGRDGKAPNNWGSWFSGPAWTYDENRKQYYLHIFAPKQPDLNWDNPQVREDVYSMMRWWLDKGIDGFRMDVIDMISKTEAFPDGEINGLYGDLAPYCIHGPHAHDYLREMNEKVLSCYDIMTVGETPCVTLEEARKYAGYDRHELGMVFQFEHVELVKGKYGKWSDERFDVKKLKEILDKWQTGMQGIAWNSLFWSNHDQPRAVSRFGDDGTYRVESAKMLATCLHMLQGTPYIYQGEELGMTNAYFENLSDYRDVESLNAYHELVEELGESHEDMMRYLKAISRDNARTPVQWNDGENAGFTDGTPWIAVNRNYRTINAEAQIRDENSVLHYYKRLIALRHEKPVIVYGDYHMLLKEDPDVFAYERTLDGVRLTVICNFADHEVGCPLLSNDAEILISNYQDRAQNVLRPFEAVVYETVV